MSSPPFTYISRYINRWHIKPTNAIHFQLLLSQMLILPATPMALKSSCNANKPAIMSNINITTQLTSPTTSTSNTHLSTTLHDTNQQERSSDSIDDDLDDQEINSTLHSASLIVNISHYITFSLRSSSSMHSQTSNLSTCDKSNNETSSS